MNNHNIPDLGAIARIPKKMRAGSGFNAMVRSLDAAGTYEPQDAQRNPDGSVTVVPHRSDFVDAEELVSMVVEALMPRIFDVIADLTKKE